MSFDSKNTIIHSVFTEEEMLEIYNIVFKNDNSYLMDLFVQTVHEFDIPYRLAKKIIGYAEDVFKVNNLEIEEYQFARYRNVIDKDTGEIKRPNLIPHCDLTFKEPRYTVDYQLGGNTDWPIIVEDKEFTLKNNEALTFSGTHQVHWREIRNFDDDEYVDMVFFHLRERNSEQYGQDVVEEVSRKMEYYGEAYNRQKNA